MEKREQKSFAATLELLKANNRQQLGKRDKPKPKPVMPTAPSALSGEALREWKRVAKILQSLGVLSKLDRATLAAYASAYARWKAATDSLSEAAVGCPYNGLLLTTTNGNVIQNPLVGIQRRAGDDVVKFAAQFGLSPSSRARLNLPNPDATPNDFSDF